ncbi:MAG: J domain-containing protein [Phototrophicaceae bacterium]
MRTVVFIARLNVFTSSTMTEKPLNWLRTHIKALPAVRGVYPSPDTEADLMIQTWVGMRVYLYLLVGKPSVRHLKRIIQQNSANYSATLFIAAHEFMPTDKTRLVPEEWMHALHELNSERIYTYQPKQEAVYQVHFDYLPDGIQREAWHGGQISFEQMRVNNVSAKFKPIRGQWMMADFGANPYWRTSDQRAERLRGRWQRENTTQAYYTWGQYDMGGGPGGADHATMQGAMVTELERASRVLGVAPDATQEEVKAAFRKLAREYHPDTSSLEKTEAEARFRELNAAYETVKEKRRWS